MGDIRDQLDGTYPIKSKDSAPWKLIRVTWVLSRK